MAAYLELGKGKEALLRAKAALSAMPSMWQFPIIDSPAWLTSCPCVSADPRVLVMVAQVLAQTGGSDAVAQAERIFTRALAIKPGHAEAMLSLADLHAQEGNPAKAIELYAL